MKINAGEIRVGMLLEYKNDLWQVLKTQHVKPGKGGAFAQIEMKSVNKNTTRQTWKRWSLQSGGVKKCYQGHKIK